LNLLLIIKIQGYGFIEPNDKSKDVFLYISAVEQDGIRKLNEGQKSALQQKHRTIKSQLLILN